MIERVSIAGDDLDLEDVFSAVTIRHGRGSVDDPPLGSTATLTLVNVTRALTAPFKVGAELELDTTGAVARFRGRVTDALLDPVLETLSVLAVSTLARISGREVGAVDWPAEVWSERVERVFTEVGELALLVLQVGDDDPMLAARDAAPATLAAALTELAGTVAAAIADLPDGTVLVQAVSARKTLDRLELDSALVSHAPSWVQTDDVRNVVRVGWDGGTDEVQDAGSITAYEEREPLTIRTTLANEDDAHARALLELSRRARPDWNVERADLLDLEDALAIGTPVVIVDLPDAAPADRAIGMLEGWEDHVEGDEWTMQLNLSPARLSGYGATWANIDPAITWDTVDPTATWAENEVLLLA